MRFCPSDEPQLRRTTVALFTRATAVALLRILGQRAYTNDITWYEAAILSQAVREALAGSRIPIGAEEGAFLYAIDHSCERDGLYVEHLLDSPTGPHDSTIVCPAFPTSPYDNTVVCPSFPTSLISSESSGIAA